jgi:hypothetical protein
MSTHEIDFAQQVPIIDSGIANIKRGIFAKLSRSYGHTVDSGQAVPLAYCVVRGIFFDPLNQSTLEEFARRNDQLIESELQKALSDPELREAISLVYAVRIMELGWQTRNPFNDDANRLVERATANGVLIPNIAEMWGPSAIVTFFQYATDFTSRNLHQPPQTS